MERKQVKKIHEDHLKDVKTVVTSFALTVRENDKINALSKITGLSKGIIIRHFVLLGFEANYQIEELKQAALLREVSRISEKHRITKSDKAWSKVLAEDRKAEKKAKK